VSAPSSCGRRAFWRRGLPALGASLTLLAACAQIVGITDTTVTDGGSVDTGRAMSDEGGSEAGPAGGDSGAEGGSALGQPDAAAEGGNPRVEPDANALPETSRQPDGGVDGPSADSSEGGDAGQRPADASPDQATADSGGCGTCPIDKPTCAGGQCTVRGPTMVQVGDFYIDSTEVTVAQYQQFLAAKGTDTSGQPSVCAWNNAYKDPTIPLNPGTWPMTSVDWCDALAYCTWAGKHLCGKIGGGPIASADALTASASQWFLACGGPGGGTHPNNNATCNSSGGTKTLAPVATFPRCEGFYPGIFDMEGNAAEWVDSCDSTDAGATDTCHLLGGSYIDNLSYCTESFDEPRNTTADPFGFRCCGG